MSVWLAIFISVGVLGALLFVAFLMIFCMGNVLLELVSHVVRLEDHFAKRRWVFLDDSGRKVICFAFEPRDYETLVAKEEAAKTRKEP